MTWADIAAATWLQADLDRLVRAANKSAVPRAVECMPDGTTRIVPVDVARQTAEPWQPSQWVGFARCE